MKELFNASFEDSKYLIHKRRWILLPGGDSDTKRIGESLLNGAALWPTLGALIGFPLVTYFSYPKNIRIWMTIIQIIAMVWIIFMADIYPRFHHKNWAEMHKKMVPSFLCFELSILILAYGGVRDIWVKNTGQLSVIIQILLIILCLITSLYYFIKIPIKKLKNGTLSIKENDKLLHFLLITDFFLLVFSFLSGTVYYMSHFNFDGETYMMSFILPLLILMEIVISFLFFKSYLSYHYIAKYPRQYRLYYKIPDSIWYFSKEEAEKRNDPVYPPKKTTNMSKEV